MRPFRPLFATFACILNQGVFAGACPKLAQFFRVCQTPRRLPIDNIFQNCYPSSGRCMFTAPFGVRGNPRRAFGTHRACPSKAEGRVVRSVYIGVIREKGTMRKYLAAIFTMAALSHRPIAAPAIPAGHQ